MPRHCFTDGESDRSCSSVRLFLLYLLNQPTNDFHVLHVHGSWSGRRGLKVKVIGQGQRSTQNVLHEYTSPSYKDWLMAIVVAWWCWLGSWTCDTKGRRFDSEPFRCHVTTVGKLCTHMCASVTRQCIGTGQRTVMPCEWEGNRRSGAALAMCHRLQWFIHLLAHGIHSSRGMTLFIVVGFHCDVISCDLAWRSVRSGAETSSSGVVQRVCRGMVTRSVWPTGWVKKVSCWFYANVSIKLRR